MTATEYHYTPTELGKLWQISERQIRRMFADVPGVLKTEIPSVLQRKRSKYHTLRIPLSVVERFHKERSAGPLEVKRGSGGIE